MPTKSKTPAVEEVHAFIDTNILVHFPFINDIDWLNLLNAKRVCLIFSPIVFKELDDIKDGMTKPGRRQLAQRVLKMIGELLEPVPLNSAVSLPKRANTSIMYASEEDLSIDSALRNEKQDDRLFAAIMHHTRAHPTDHVILISDDFNCRQRAKSFGITARTLPEALKRPLPRTEEEERLKRLEALEPQVAVELGADGDVLELPYNELRTRWAELAKSYAQGIAKTAEALGKDYQAIGGNQVAYVHGVRRPIRLQNLKDEDRNHYNPRDQKVISAVRALELDVFIEWLNPQPRVRNSWNYEPTNGSREPFELWQANVESIRSLAASREKDLYYAVQALQFYALPIVLRHASGNGVEDGQITLTLEEPLQFMTYAPPCSEDREYAYRHPLTKWIDKPDKPSATHSTPQTKTFKFGNLHPGATVECDPLFIYIESASEATGGKAESRLTVEVSGLNMRMPFRKVITARFV